MASTSFGKQGPPKPRSLVTSVWLAFIHLSKATPLRTLSKSMPDALQKS